MDWKRYVRMAMRTEQDRAGYDQAIERLKQNDLLYESFRSGLRCLDAADHIDGLKKLIFYGKNKNQKESYPDYFSNTDPGHLKGKGIRILQAAMGLVTESAEMLEAVLKSTASPYPYDVTNIAEEAGDLLWYLAILLDALDLPIEQILESNIAKLQARYKDRFTNAEAQERDLVAEREAIQNQRQMAQDALQSAMSFDRFHNAMDAAYWRGLVAEAHRLDALRGKPASKLTDAEVKAIVYDLMSKAVKEKISAEMPVITVDLNVDAGSFVKAGEVICRQELRQTLSSASLKSYKPGSDYLGEDDPVQAAINERMQAGLAAMAARDAQMIRSTAFHIKESEFKAPTADEIGSTTPPARYNHGEREAIDEIRDALGDELFAGFCAGQVIKYRYRQGAKPGDAEKLAWYGKMLNHLSGAEPDPRSGRPDFQPYECPGIGSGNKWWHKLQTLEKYALIFSSHGRLMTGPLHKV